MGGAITPIARNSAAVSDIPDNPEKCFFFLDYRGFLVTDGENGHRIWIFRSKYTILPWIKEKTFILDVFNLVSFTVIAQHSELPTHIFRDTENYSDWWYYRIFFLPVEFKSCINFREQAPETPDNLEILFFFRIIEGSRFWPTKMVIGFGFYRSKYMNWKRYSFSMTLK